MMEAEKVVAELRRHCDSWRRVAERLGEEKRVAEARVTAVEAEKAGLVKALEPFALISSEGVSSRETTGHVEIVTCAEYFHAAADALSRFSTEAGDENG